MKQHHLSLTGLEQNLIIAMRRNLELITPFVPETSEAGLIYALADLLAERAGNALEQNGMSEKALRDLITDIREVVFRRKVRPIFSSMDRQILGALGRRSMPVTLDFLADVLQLSRASVNTALYRCMHRGLVLRTFEGSSRGLYALSELAKEFRDPQVEEPAPTLNIGAGALVQNPRIARMKRNAAPYMRPKR